jgi:1,4-dihydroxy-2-naphthoate octaprenyltransferase
VGRDIKINLSTSLGTGKMDLKKWFQETRPNFLLLTPIAFSVGLASAYIDGSFDVLRALLGLIGVLLAHISINVINDYFDYKSGLDFKTRPTPFSGGSSMLPSGTLEAKDVYRFAMASLIIGFAIGSYFVYTTGWMLLPLIVAAAVSIYFYTPGFSRFYIGEIVTGLNFGPLIVPGILVGTLLFLNEFPDLDADREVGRRNVVISLGLEKASKIYAVLISSTYVWVMLCVLLRWLPFTVLVTYLTLPTALKAIRGVLRDHGDVGRLIPAMGENVKLVLSMTGMTTIGLMLSLLF